jgi:hypothetical protein
VHLTEISLKIILPCPALFIFLPSAALLHGMEDGATGHATFQQLQCCCFLPEVYE